MYQFSFSNTNKNRMNLFKQIVFSIGVSSLIACGSSSDKGPTVSTVEVTTTLGTISTKHSSDESMISFKGIPYAEPPVGDLRFADPVAITGYSSTVDATEYGSNCPQNESSIESGSTNEDCLFINVFTPDGEIAASNDYPVLLWIHGGAFVSGSGGPVYSPDRLVEQDVIVVTFNYRLGAFGFMSFDGVVDGNWGLKDQQVAMQWVKNHISNFGGNPDNITLFGESAGGHSVMSHIAAPLSKSENLFSKAIVQSGHFYADQWDQARSDDIGGKIATAVKTATGCTDDAATCIRNASVADILAAQTTVLEDESSGSYYPTYGGEFLPESFKTRITAGTDFYHNVPMLTGSNSDEGTFFTALNELTTIREEIDKVEGTPTIYDFLAALDLAAMNTEAKYDTAVSGLLTPLGLNATQIGDDYLSKLQGEVDPEDLYSLAYSAIQTDFLFACPSLEFAELFAANENSIYMYRFSDQDAPNLFYQYDGNWSQFPTGAAHGFDVQYVLGSEEDIRKRGGGDAQIALSDAMIQYWTQFAKEGTPNATGSTLDSWSTYGTESFILELTTPSISASNKASFSESHDCVYWATPPQLPQ